MTIPYGRGANDARWWLTDNGYDEEPTTEPEAPDDGVGVSNVHKHLVSLVTFLRRRQTMRRQYDLFHARVYGNLRYLGFGLNSYAQLDNVEDERITMNVTENMISAVVSRITKNKPKATVIPTGGMWTMHNRAKNLEKFINGQWYKNGFRRLAVDAFRDACIYGTGALKIYGQGAEVKAERVPPWLLIVDDSECLLGDPRNLYEIRYLDKSLVKAVFAKGDKEIEERIESCKLQADDLDGFGYDSTADQCVVYEAWHLPSSPDAGDGRHVICIDNCTLVDEVWELPRFPFVFCRWSKAPVGFFGIGLTARLTGLQAEINKLLRQIQQAHHLCAWPRVFVPRGSKVLKSQLTNMIGAVIEHDGAPPTQASFPVIPQEVYNHLQFLIKSAYEQAGISQLTATSGKPAGIESGIAMMTLQDVQSDRFTEIATGWDMLFQDSAELHVEWARIQAKKGSDMTVLAIGGKEAEVINWEDACMEMHEYALQITPTSELPNTPGGRLEWAERMSQAGQLQGDEAFQIINIPDLETLRAYRMADKDIIDKVLEKIYDTGIFISPEPNDNLQYGLTKATQTYHLAQLHNAPEAVLKSLRTYMLRCTELLNPPAPPPGPAAPGPAGPEGAPPADGMAPPPPPGMEMGPPGAPPGAAPPM